MKQPNITRYLDTLRARLAASTDHEGKPKLGYKARVAALQAVIKRAEAKSV